MRESSTFGSPYQVCPEHILDICEVIETTCKPFAENVIIEVSVKDGMGKIATAECINEIPNLDRLDINSILISFEVYERPGSPKPSIDGTVLFASDRRVYFHSENDMDQTCEELYKKLVESIRERSIINIWFYAFKYALPIVLAIASVLLIALSATKTIGWSDEYESVINQYNNAVSMEEKTDIFFNAMLMQVRGEATTKKWEFNPVTIIAGILCIIGFIIAIVKSNNGYAIFPKNFLAIGDRNRKRRKAVKETQDKFFWRIVVPIIVLIIIRIIFDIVQNISN